MEFEQLQKDMIAAMKAKDKVRKEAISALVSGAKKVAIDQGVRDHITPEIVNAVITKELKTLKEQIDTCPAERTELLAEYQNRYAIIQEYAPTLLNAQQVEAILKEKYADVLATGNKGQIMKAVMSELKGKADGKVINEVVTRLCS